MFFLGFPAFDTRAEAEDWLKAKADPADAALPPSEPRGASAQPQFVESVGGFGSCSRVRMASGDVFWVPLSREQLIEGWAQILNKAGRRQQLALG